MKLNSKHTLTVAMLPFLLNACAGGGNVSVPEIIVPQIVARALDKTSASVQAKPDTNVATFSSNSDSKIEQYTISEPSIIPGVLRVEDELVYTLASGKSYRFDKFNTLVLTSQSTPGIRKLPNVQAMTPTDDGGRIIACCDSSVSGMLFSDLKASRFGIWMSPTGQAEVFSGGKLAVAADLQGSNVNGQPKGKATYQVVALRSKGNHAVTSTFESTYTSSSYATAVNVSRLTVNFNTNKLGGTIIGNQDFGAPVEMKDVTLNGSKFSGTAESAGKIGRVEGGLFGEAWRSPYSGNFYYNGAGGKEIGGVITFPADKSLNTAFGGVRSNYDDKTDSQDLTPVNN
ncbi:transferrin-binding protein-like solute binding protein [Kingella kingae]|uniref:transferrin-binding protein-like solute binding protein n=1 Tax=Kingella kingae TaxID=504 RepID=UPI0003F9FA96|nr:transferrin-binding protein-like solute binding protein [Kingella kingae]MDK4624945.1 transferrin-binding protein-like solute binding protein [Kingella kingae]MDK4660618.1 transferrin-binding protein-like solute binding protein [Kingella kingae]MDK4668575.1 transferrin-binding protein-like solute binding protein [Kingella kingae]MDK4686950.1 transferrin-binding protein-like solute binding protein [Kingella kingae]